jgi:iron complex transport system substrate-binding protein
VVVPAAIENLNVVIIGPRRSGRQIAGVATVLAVGLTLISGCRSSSADSAAESPTPSSQAVDNKEINPLPGKPVITLPATTTSADGNKTTVTDISRIVTLTGGVSEIVFTLNLGDKVVGRDIATTFTAAASLPIVTHAHDVSAESVLSLHPTVVVADSDTGPSEAISAIRKAGVPMVIVPPATTLADVGTRIHLIADALGARAAGSQLADRTAAEIEAAQKNVPKNHPKLTVAFLYVRGTAGVYLIGGKGSGADSLIAAAGAIDAGTKMNLKTFTPITSEALIGAQPDVILVMTDGLSSVGGIDGLVKLPGVAQTPAGKNKKVIAIEDGVLLNFGPRTAAVVSTLISDLYPS